MSRDGVPYGYTQSSVRGNNIYTVDPDDPENEERAAKETIRLGLIGAGSISQGKHLPAINRLQAIDEPVEVVSIADPQEKFGKKAADQYSANWYTDYEEMLESEDLDAIEHTTGPAIASQILEDVLERGVHVLREKPLMYEGLEEIDETIKKAERICDIADRNGAVLMTGFCKRFAPPYAKAKQLIDEGEIGDPAMMAGKMVQSWADDGLLEMQTCHMIDLLRYIMGDVASIDATGVNKYDGTEYDVDNAIIQFTFESGSIGTLYQNSTSPNMKPWERIEVFGDGRWLQVEDSLELRLYDSEEGPTKSWEPALPNTLLFDEEFGGYVGEIENFLDAVRGLQEPLVTGRDGYEALGIARATHRSIEENERVTLS